MKINDLPNVLILTGTPGMAAVDFYMALKSRGFEVDLLTLRKVKGYPEFLSVFNFNIRSLPEYFHEKWLNHKRRKISHKVFKAQTVGASMFYSKETEPVVPTSYITRKIKKKYDIVYVVFWSPLFTFETIKAIYEQTGAQVHFRCVDNSPIAGGCHFIGDCSNLQSGCGHCPLYINSPDMDFTKFNVTYRQEFYKTVKPIVYGNTHMMSIYKKSFLLRDYDRLELDKAMVIVDDKCFCPIDKKPIRKKFEIPEEKKYVIAFGSQSLSEKRKGMTYLLNALNIFRHRLTENQQNEIVLLIIGNDIEKIKKDFPFDYIYLGYLPYSALANFYNAADVYLSPSIDDAGPSMVNQSLSCGTPVVAFEIGTAIDMVKGQNTGYCARKKDAEDFAEGIWKCYNQNEEERNRVRENCRELALKMTSEEAFVNNLLTVYKKYQSKC